MERARHRKLNVSGNKLRAEKGSGFKAGVSMVAQSV